MVTIQQMKTIKFKTITHHIRQIIMTSALALLVSTNAHALLILDVNVGGGPSEYTNKVFDGEDAYINMSGLGGWSLLIASAGAEPDYSGGKPEVHLSLIANCKDSNGCASLKILAASDYPVGADRINLQLGTVPGNNVTSSAYLFTGTYTSGSSPVITETSTTASWSTSFDTLIPMVGFNTDTIWGLSAELNSPTESLSSLDFKVAVPEPGVIELLIFGILALGLTLRTRRFN